MTKDSGLRGLVFGLTFCLSSTLADDVLASGPEIGIRDPATDAVVCRTQVSPLASPHDTAGAGIYELGPGESVEIPLEVSVHVSTSTRGVAWRAPEGLDARWRILAPPGAKSPAEGKARLTRNEAGPSDAQGVGGRFAFRYTAPAEEGLYTLPVKVELDPGQARAEDVPETCGFATGEIVVLVRDIGSGPEGTPPPQYAFNITGVVPGGRGYTIGSWNGTFRMDEGGRLHGAAEVSIRVEGECVRSLDRLPLRVEGRGEGNWFHLRLPEDGGQVNDYEWVSEEMQCFLIGLKEVGSMLGNALADLRLGEEPQVFRVVGEGQAWSEPAAENWSRSIRGLR